MRITLPLAAIAAILLAAGCGKPPAKTTAASPALSVTLTVPLVETWPVFVSAAGTITPWQEAIVGSDVAGYRLSEVRADVGTPVRKGEVLARLDPASAQVAVRQAEAAVAEAEASLALARDNEARAEALAAEDAISGQDRAVFRTQALSAKARVAAARAQLDAQRLLLSRMEIRAPDDGTLSSRSATVGAVTTAGGELFRLIRGNRLEWRAEIPAERFGDVKAGQKAVFGPGKPEGTVTRLAPSMDATHVGIAYVDLPAGAFKAGQYVTGTVGIGNAAALTVPSVAVVVRDGNAFVAVVEGGKARFLKVRTGRIVGGRIELVEPKDEALKGGVVASGAAFLTDGDAVSVEAAQ